MEIRYKISPQDFYDMRDAVNWTPFNLKQSKKALDNSMIVVGIYDENTIVAMGRLVGEVVTSILEQCRKDLDAGNRICIEANPTIGNREFYISCGLEYKPEEQDGVEIWLENL